MTGDQVRRLFDVCETWPELLCLATFAYSGARRAAVSKLRWRDIDRERGVMTFREKGGKIVRKPLPDTYAAILNAAIEVGAVSIAPREYVVPSERLPRRAERDDRVIYRIVKRLGARAGVDVHPHALRHAFSVRFLEQHPGEIEALQRILGHSKLETTQRYLRSMEQERLMERMRDLNWGTRYEASGVEAPSGFEPLYGALQAPA